jgi:hypothetical protein
MLRYAFLVLALVLSGCDTRERISRLERQSADLKAEVEKNQMTAANYDFQARCARDAKTWFDENWSRDKTTMLLTYSNHYQKRSNKCFILVEFHYLLGPEERVMDKRYDPVGRV